MIDLNVVSAVTQVAIATLAASFVIAQIRRNLELLVLTVCNSIIAVVSAVEVAVTRAIAAFTDMIQALADDLASFAVPVAESPATSTAVNSPTAARTRADTVSASSGATDVPRHRRMIVDASGPLFYFAASITLLAGDLYLAALRAGPLFGFEVSESLLKPGDSRVELLAGLLYVITTVVFAAVLFEVIGVGTRRPPFGTVGGPGRIVVTAIAAVGTALSAVVASMLFVWAQSAASGEPNDALARQFFALFAPLLVMATALAFVGARQSVTAFRYIVVVMLRWLAAALQLTAQVSVRVVAAPRDVGVTAIRVASTPGQTLWDWICRMRWAERLHLEPLPPLRAEPPTEDQASDEASPRERILVDSSAAA